jgi:hypothetical protein
MYFDESLKLTTRFPLDKIAVKMLDRELAHAYAPGGHGSTDTSLLQYRTGLSQADILRLLPEYELAGVIVSYAEVECACGEKYDPAEAVCPNCALDVTASSPTGVTRHRIKTQPTSPAYDPLQQPALPNVFISYRHAESSKLAADIYYSLRTEGHAVFLDNGNIAPGADAEKVFLLAASQASYFIALVSRSYFESPYCKKEIAHAARQKRRLLRVNIPPTQSAPSDMPWIDGPNWLMEPGEANGLSLKLEQALLSAVTIQPTAGNIADLRIEACQFLMDQLSPNDLARLWNRLSWLREITPDGSKARMIRQILEESTGPRMDVLCNALAP